MPLFIQLVYRTSNDDNVYKLLHFKQDVLNIFRTDKINFYLKNGALSIEIFNPAPSKVSIKSVLSSNVVNDSAINKNTVSAVGVSYDSNNIIFDFEKDPSTLIVGKPGSGAIMEISSLIMSRIYHNTPDQLKLLLCSVKEEKVFETFSGLTHLYTAPSMNQEDTAINLTNILNLIEHRTKLFSEKRCNNINEYNNLPNEEKVPNILIAIFDLESFFRASANNPNILLRILSNEAIKVGIQVILYSENIDELL
ncbi:MAG: hypothetical protein K2M43_01165 [Mycoplasmoidaceae bacterium]|nr:hypothetical protein [Mycoplasmoidaceae bacterium]